MMNMVNIATQSTTIPQRIGGTINPDLETLIAHGWRIRPEIPPVADGYERSAVAWVDAGDGRTAAPIYHDTSIAARLADEASAKLATFPAQEAALFRLTMRRNFGPDAETNRAIGAGEVEAFFAQKQVAGTITTQELADAVMLSRLFKELAAWNGTGETWTLPWDMVPEAQG